MTDELIRVRVVGLPIAVRAIAAEHVDGLQREFDLLTRSDLPPGSVPVRLLELIDEIQNQYGGIGDRPAAELQAAIAAGRDTVDLEYHVPPAIADASRRVGELLDEADRYCRSGNLVTLVTPAVARRYRQWFLREFIEQVAGRPPTPWSDFEDAAVPVGSVDGDEGSRAGAAAPATLRLDGELDLTNAATVREALRSLGPDADARIRVDLSAVTFVDSAALSVLVAAHSRFDRDGVEMRVLVNPRVMRTMQLACLDEVLHLDLTAG